MSDYYPDEEKKRRYDVLHVRKNRCEKTFDLLMVAVLGVTVLESVFNYYFWIMDLAAGGRMALISMNLDAGMRLCMFWGLIKRKKWLTVIAGALTALAYVLSWSGVKLPPTMYLFSVVVLMVLFWTQAEWEHLQQEEGFPNFEIDFREIEQSRPDYHPELSVRTMPASEPAKTAPEQPIIRRGGPEDMDTI